MESRLDAGQNRFGFLWMPTRHGLHPLYIWERWNQCKSFDFCSDSRQLWNQWNHNYQHNRLRAHHNFIFLYWVLSLECNGWYDKLPAKLKYRRSRDYRLPHLPQNRIPRAPQPLCGLCRKSWYWRIWYKPRRLSWCIPQCCRPSCHRTGKCYRFDRKRLVSDWFTPD